MNATQSNPLAARAMVCMLKTGAWRATRLHAQETEAENERHGVENTATVMVRLTQHPALHELGKLHALARSEHYGLTLPTGDEGMRLCPVGRIMEHSAKVQARKVKHDVLVSAFLAAYDEEKRTAPARLNGLFKAEFFPDKETVAARFRFESRYLPVPTEGLWQDWLREAGDAAEADLRERFRECLARVVERLSTPDATFRDSLIGNLRSLCELSGDLNLTQAADIVAASAAIASDLVTISPDTLRESNVTRADAARRASAIANMLKP